MKEIISPYLVKYLRDENVRLREHRKMLQEHLGEVRKDRARLFAEVDRLQAALNQVDADNTHDYTNAMNTLRAALGTRDVHGLVEGIERLVKQRDELRALLAMASRFETGPRTRVEGCNGHWSLWLHGVKEHDIDPSCFFPRHTEESERGFEFPEYEKIERYTDRDDAIAAAKQWEDAHE